MTIRNQYDCVVIGGGPAGCTAAALVADAGFSTLLVERDAVPRFHVGESLMPETYWTLKRLGVLEEMKASANPKKFSVQFVSHTGRESQPFYFFKRDEHESSQTWQVLRSQFDQMLWNNAAAKGADCHDRTRVVEVLFESDRACGVRVKDSSGQARDVAASVVIDATGQQALVANRLGLVEPNQRLKKAAIWTYYRGARRDSGVDEGATIILHTKDKQTWFWFIPLLDDVTSVGVVGDVDYVLKQETTPERTFETELSRCENMMARLAKAERTEEYRVTREFSYSAKRPAGDGWVLIGDAFGFVDPIYSSGVFLALKSAEMAADCVIEGLKRGDTSSAQLGKWVPEYQAGVELIRKLVHAFYTDDFSFGRFIKAYPQHQGNLTDLLVGKLFKPGVGEIFNDMDAFMAKDQAGMSSAPADA